MYSPQAKMLKSLNPGMTTPEVVCCIDDHFCWVWAWAIHQRLSQADSVGLCGSKLAPKVSFQSFLHIFTWWFMSLFRCTTPSNDYACLTHKNIQSLSWQSLSQGNSGMNMAPLKVLGWVFIYNITLMCFIAVYKWIYMGGYLQASITWPTSPTYQRHFKRPSSNVDCWLHWMHNSNHQTKQILDYIDYWYVI